MVHRERRVEKEFDLTGVRRFKDEFSNTETFELNLEG